MVNRITKSDTMGILMDIIKDLKTLITRKGFIRLRVFGRFQKKQ